MRIIKFVENGCSYMCVPEQQYLNFVEVSIWMWDNFLGMVDCEEYPEGEWEHEKEEALIKQVSDWLLDNE
jgi:hypothetical protein